MNYEFLIILVPVILFSLTIHEYAHALLAYRLGDDTAKRQGRLSLNPLVHLDILGTLLLFIVHFGWAKPVPVDPLNFR
ncbi:MAG: site-2 protease family protein, partial [Candidatus Dadabacteria bacterium]|nr:site-2 protease family protein [Candidatus Dadabacteria bacterium]